MNHIIKPDADETLQGRDALRAAQAHLAFIKGEAASVQEAIRRASGLIATMRRQLEDLGDVERQATRWRTTQLKAGESAAPLPVDIGEQLQACVQVEADLKAAMAAKDALDQEAHALSGDLVVALKAVSQAAAYTLRVEVAEEMVVRLREVERQRRELRTSLTSYLNCHFGLPSMDGLEHAKLSPEGTDMIRYPEPPTGRSLGMMTAWRDCFLALASDPEAHVSPPDYIKPHPGSLNEC